MSRPDKERLLKIKKYCNELTAVVTERNITESDILNDRFIQWAVTTPLFNIGEQVSHLSAELKGKYPDIPWKNISALRNRLVHSYEYTRWDVISAVVFKDIPAFKAEIDKILSESAEDEQNG